LFLWFDRFLVVIFVLIVINVSLIEFLRFCHRKNIFPYPACIFVPANLIPVGIYYSVPPGLMAAATFLYVTTLSLLRFEGKSYLDRIGVTFFAIIYVGLLPCSVILLRRIGFGWCLFPMILTWVFDTGAYLAGVAFGRHRLAPSVSPKKSYEGLAGGLIVAVPAAYALNLLLRTGLAISDQIIVAVGVAALSTVGDLFESAFKRETGLKDTSNIFPGHGGMLDRIDSLLFTVPFFYVFLRLIGH
jgi:phosphatidate cytidylyltransferase